MMSPTIVLRDGEIELGLGSAGSNRIRSAILQTVLRVLEDGMGAGDAVRSGRIHFEAGTVQAEPRWTLLRSSGSRPAGSR